jgi:hypothetical protein
MIKVEYGLPKGELNSRYLLLFNPELVHMDQVWKDILVKIGKQYSTANIPTDIRKILTADYPTLVDIFQK